jgi:hypothetical protein
VCIKDHKDVILSGNEVSMNSMSLSFEISKCSDENLDEGDLPCASQDEIEEYIQDIQVESWANFDHTVFNIHDSDPLKRVEKYLKSDLIESGRILKNYVLLRKNNITTEDSLFSTDETTFEHIMYDINDIMSEKAFPSQ